MTNDFFYISKWWLLYGWRGLAGALGLGDGCVVVNCPGVVYRLQSGWLFFEIRWPNYVNKYVLHVLWKVVRLGK